VNVAGLRTRFPDLPDSEGMYAVGGAVRDLLSGRNPIDLDLTCIDAAQAAEVLAQSIHGKVIVLGGERLATWRVVGGSRIYDFAEITGGSIENDLMRRDFTINAMAIEVATGALIDPLQGAIDLRDKVIRMVRESNLGDDPLRILRGIRMASGFAFTIEPETLSAMMRLSPGVLQVAAERVRYELDTLLGTNGASSAVSLLRLCGLDRALFGEAFPSTREDQLARVNADRISAYALLLEGRTDAEVREFAARWRWSEADRRALLSLRRLVFATRSEESIDAALFDAGSETADRAVTMLDGLGEERLRDLVSDRVRRGGQTLFGMVTLLDGDEIAGLMATEAGPRIGVAKQALLEAQLEGKVRTREEAELFVRALAEE